MNAAGNSSELQGTGEEATFSETQLAEMLRLGKEGISRITPRATVCPGRNQAVVSGRAGSVPLTN